MMKRKQREMQENGGSPGCPGLVVSRSLADVTNTTRMDAYWCMLMSCFMKWRTTAAITSLRVTVRRKRWRLQKRKKKMNPQGRSLLSMWVPWGKVKPMSSFGQAIWHLVSLLSVKLLVWYHFLARVQCLGHQLEEGSEGPEEREKGNKEGRKEENKERAAETAGWENFTLILPYLIKSQH